MATVKTRTRDPGYKKDEESTMRAAQWTGVFNKGMVASTPLLPAGQFGTTLKAGHQLPWY